MMRTELGMYRLDGHEPVPVYDTSEWARAFAATDGTVAQDFVGRVEVVTYFLGVDYHFHREGAPLLFETGIFPSKRRHDRLARRYHTWAEAEAGHAEIVAELRRERSEGK
jgi:hypothetical protein